MSVIETVQTWVREKEKRNRRRIQILDAVRGIAILAMIVHHTMYDIEDIFGRPVVIPPIPGRFLESTFFLFLRQPFTWAFILLAGISCRFSHNNWLRGVKVFGCGMLLTLVTAVFMPSEIILFGILHFMGAAILLFALLGPLLDRIPPGPALVLWTFLFAVTFTTPETRFVGLPPLLGVTIPPLPGWLFPLGVPSDAFYSADYFPLMPWFFLFLIGTVLGRPIRERRLPEKFYTARVPFFAFAGRHTLGLYIIHQPIVYGILWLLFHFHVLS